MLYLGPHRPADQQPGYPHDPLFFNQRTVLLASRAGSLVAADLPGGQETAAAHVRALLAHPGRPHDVDLKLLDHYEVPAQVSSKALPFCCASAAFLSKTAPFLAVCLPVCLSVCLSACVCVCVCVSVCPRACGASCRRFCTGRCARSCRHGAGRRRCSSPAGAGPTP
eukprot:SAG22_NODE_4989_length_1114_cov_1.016749_2_plen_166_part_01